MTAQQIIHIDVDATFFMQIGIGGYLRPVDFCERVDETRSWVIQRLGWIDTRDGVDLVEAAKKMLADEQASWG
jgi:hypothetical protein